MQQKWNQNFDGEPMTDIPQKFLNAGCDVYMVMQESSRQNARPGALRGHLLC